MLEVRDIYAAYDRNEVLHGVSLVVGDNEFVCVIGPNTAGKSTLLRTISRLILRSRGEISFDNQALMPLPAHRVPELGIAHVPEGRQVFPEMTVEDNLLLGAFVRGTDAPLADLLASVYDFLPRLCERRRQLAGTLSGGEQQMLAIGRALMLDPKLLMLDEPSLGLAPRVVEELHEKLVQIHQSGRSILLVEQNVAMALSVAQRGYVLEGGKVVLTGPVAQLRDDDRIRAVYLGI